MRGDLVLQAQRGDHEAFSTLVGASVDRLHAVARLILRDQDAAEDAVQDALVRAWVGLKGLRDPERFDAWLQRLLVHGCYRAARRRRHHELTEVPMLPGDEPLTADTQRAVALRDQLERGFRRLSTEHRVVIVLHFYLDLPDAEAADILGAPIGTYKSRLHRAVSTLRAVLDADARPAAALQGRPA